MRALLPPPVQPPTPPAPDTASPRHRHSPPALQPPTPLTCPSPAQLRVPAEQRAGHRAAGRRGGVAGPARLGRPAGARVPPGRCAAARDGGRGRRAATRSALACGSSRRLYSRAPRARATPCPRVAAASAGIYGPGRSLLDALSRRAAGPGRGEQGEQGEPAGGAGGRRGGPSASQARRGRQRYTARLHVGDIAAALVASLRSPTPGEVRCGNGPRTTAARCCRLRSRCARVPRPGLQPLCSSAASRAGLSPRSRALNLAVSPFLIVLYLSTGAQPGG
jgi:hypothetical protein